MEHSKEEIFGQVRDKVMTRHHVYVKRLQNCVCDRVGAGTRAVSFVKESSHR